MARIPIQCFHFDPEGNRIGKGCPRGGDCHYVHPADYEWSTTPRSKKSPIRRRSRSPPRRPPRSPSPAGRRHDSGSLMDYRADNYRKRPGPSSIASRSPPPPPPRPPPLDAPFKPLPPAYNVPPPPPLLPPPPIVPNALSRTSQSSPAPKLSTRAEMKVHWERLLPLIANCVEARKAHQESLANFHDFEKLQRTQYYQNLHATVGKESVDEELAKLKAVADEKSKVVTEALRALNEANWWPTGPQNEGSADDMVKYLRELDRKATELHQEYLKNANNPVASASSVPEAAHTPNASSSSAPRPLKRRRLSEDAPPLTPAEVAEFEKLQEKLEALEERFCELENGFYSLESQTYEDMTALVENRLESAPSDSADRTDAVANYSALEQMNRTVTQTTSNMTELTGAVSVLTERWEHISDRSKALEDEAQRYPEELMALQQRLQAYDDSHERDIQAMQALDASLAALKKRTAAPSSLPLEFILRAIDEPIRDGVETAMRPIVEKLEKDLDEKIVKQDAETYSQLWTHLARTFQVLSVIDEVTPTPPAKDSLPVT